MERKLSNSLLVLLVAGVVWTSVWAQAPNNISYSGVLTNAQGEPREGPYNLTFRIYDSPVGGVPLHVQPISNVIVRRGQFNVLLGPFADNVFLQGSGARYVEVQVGTEPPLLPRQQLTSVPFAQRTASIDGARGGTLTGGLNVSGNVGIGTTNPNHKLEIKDGRIAFTNDSYYASGFGQLMCTAGPNSSCDFWTGYGQGGLLLIHEWHGNEYASFGQKLYMFVGHSADPGRITQVSMHGANECSVTWVEYQRIGPAGDWSHRWRLTNRSNRSREDRCNAYYLRMH